jgi:hypothetical protein
MGLARSRRRSVFGLSGAIAASAVIVGAIGVAAVVTIRSRIEQRAVGARAHLTEEFDSIALPQGFTLVRTERGGEVWKFPLDASRGPFETRVFEIERGRRDAYQSIVAGLAEQGFRLERFGGCYIAAERKPVDLTVTFSSRPEQGGGSSRCPEAGWPRAFVMLHLILLV